MLENLSALNSVLIRSEQEQELNLVNRVNCHAITKRYKELI